MANRLRQPQSITEKNAAILKELLRRPENRVCADCHVNTHPRWTSWNLGVFICIRCSGIHRGMGTHISRVKSADLDAWTEEQTQMMVKWGNRRANKYWEALLSPSHIPSDAKMENFIRSKYSSKRWVLSPTPPADPSVLDDIADEDGPTTTKAPIVDQDSVPLAIVKQSLIQQSSRPQQANLLSSDTPPRRQTPDLHPLRTDSPPPKPSRPRQDRVSNQSLLGLEFDSPVRTKSAPQFPTTTTSKTIPTTTPAPSRDDLKNSILKLYAPKPVTAPSTSAVTPVTTPSVGSSALLADLNSAFGGLSMPSSSAAPSSVSAGNKPPVSGEKGTTSTLFPTGKLSFGQTSNASIVTTKPAQPTSFTIPIKKVTPAPTPPVATPPLPQTTTNTTGRTMNLLQELPTSNYTPTFNLSKAPPPQSTPTPPATTQKGIQLLSTTVPTAATSLSASTSPPRQSSSSSFANPWTTTTNSSNQLSLTSDPWAGMSSTTNPSTTTFGDAFSSPSNNTKPSSNAFGDLFSSSTKPTNATFGDSFSLPKPANPTSGTSVSSTKNANQTSFGDPFSSSAKSMGGFGDSWGTMETSTTGNTTEQISGGGTNKGFDEHEFGLFETSDAWK